MFSWLDAVKCAFSTLEHAHEFAVDIGVDVMATFAPGELIVNLDFVAALENLAFGGREDLTLAPSAGLSWAMDDFAGADLTAGCS